MKTHTGIIKEAHAEFDRRWSKLLRQHNTCVTCFKGCSACCSEQLVVSEAEAKLIVASVPPAEREGVRERTRTWLDRIRQTDLLTRSKVDVVEWLRAGLVCPLLKNNLCLVYQNRPLGCRHHTAIRSPALCGSPDTRKQQRYANNDEITVLIGLMITQASRRMDHLGVYLSRWLLCEKVDSAAAATFPVEFIGTSENGTVANYRQIP